MVADDRCDLISRRATLSKYMRDINRRMMSGGEMNESDGRDFDILLRQLVALDCAIDPEARTAFEHRMQCAPKSGPEEDDEPGGDIDWGDGGPLSAS